MPGQLFATKLGQDAFPLRSSKEYIEINADIGGKLKALHRYAGVPAPAPEKPMHGDIDFAVCDPIGTVSPAQIQRILGPGVQVEVEEGSRIAHYAVPVPDGKFIQVNVETCDNKPEFDGIMFFRSYGDLGMILGLLARAHGLSLGSKGLKVGGQFAISRRSTLLIFFTSFFVDSLVSGRQDAPVIISTLLVLPRHLKFHGSLH